MEGSGQNPAAAPAAAPAPPARPRSPQTRRQDGRAARKERAPSKHRAKPAAALARAGHSPPRRVAVNAPEPRRDPGGGALPDADGKDVQMATEPRGLCKPEIPFCLRVAEPPGLSLRVPRMPPAAVPPCRRAGSGAAAPVCVRAHSGCPCHRQAGQIAQPCCSSPRARPGAPFGNRTPSATFTDRQTSPWPPSPCNAPAQSWTPLPGPSSLLGAIVAQSSLARFTCTPPGLTSGTHGPAVPSRLLPLTPRGTLTQRRNPPRGRDGRGGGPGRAAGEDLRLHRRGRPAVPRLRGSVLPRGRASRAPSRAEPSRAEPTRPDPRRASGAAAEPAGPAMGCSSSARSRPQEPPPLPASSGANTLTSDDPDTVADQTQLDPAECVSLASDTNPGKQLPGEEASATILDAEGKTESVSKREEPEGTEPLPAGDEESSELPSVWREESRGPSPPAPEDAGAPSPGPAGDSGLVEGSDNSAVGVVEEVHTTEEDHLIEGNSCAFINSGNQNLSPGTSAWVPVALLRASNELLESEFGPGSLSNVRHRRMCLGKPWIYRSKL
ncbi:uncharacterized protein LOC134563383 [Prinia subflava]|uniref:uncharacterized protein LOC134563383 n=1 Tax=Prinia subflava TaxID=208062 RepID=UPI002FE1C1E1